MSKLGSLILGVAVAVFFSFWPMRLANAICCLGITLGGGLAAFGMGRAQGESLEPTQGLRRGMLTGVLTAVVLLLINLLIFSLGLVSEGPTVFVDAIPNFVYGVLLAFWSGLMNIVSGETSVLSPADLGLWARFFINLFNDALFGAFGGALAGTFFNKEPARTD